MRVEPSSLNGMPALIIYSGDRVDLVALIESSNEHVTGVYLVRNPDKLGAATEARSFRTRSAVEQGLAEHRPSLMTAADAHRLHGGVEIDSQ